MLSDKKRAFLLRKKRIKKDIFGTKDMPRMTVGRSNKYLYVQFIDDLDNCTLLSVSSKTLKMKNSANIKAASELGKTAGGKALALGIKKVVFDRGGYLYHGRIKALADSAREAGLKF
ncbi:MAG: 50S ribosomal protein L18 [Elusimicrobia bacterium ADurb.Bin231]|nr:MAG: 50S ribosomal protein L18 [Elusimicrobia bacterium ADurb.Bin231]